MKSEQELACGQWPQNQQGYKFLQPYDNVIDDEEDPKLNGPTAHYFHEHCRLIKILNDGNVTDEKSRAILENEIEIALKLSLRS